MWAHPTCLTFDQRIDLTGKTVMPAIVDAHKHVSADRDELVEQLQRFAYYGVGMVMSLGLDQGDLAAQVQGETIPNAARLRTAGRGMTGEEPGRAPTPYWLTSEEEARAAVQEQAAAGIGLIKIWVDTRGGEYEKLTPELYGAVIDEAHANNMRVTAHIFELEDAKGLLEAGIDAFAHGVRDQDIDDEFIAMVLERPDLVLVPNMPDRGVAVDMSWLSGSLPADQVEQLQANSTDRPAAQESFGIQSRNLGRLNEAGMTIAFGTDGSTDWAQHVEMVDMVESGMTPAQVIVAATSNSAALLELDDVGMVATGKSADFIVLNANPLDDITNTRQIDSVYLRGDMVDRAALSAQWTAEPSE
jgi:imidazolonepropionase-like amidohydrolase